MLKKFYDEDGQFLFEASVNSEEELLNILKNNNVVKSISGLMIEEDHEGRLFITDGIEEVATVDP